MLLTIPYHSKFSIPATLNYNCYVATKQYTTKSHSTAQYKNKILCLKIMVKYSRSSSALQLRDDLKQYTQ